MCGCSTGAQMTHGHTRQVRRVVQQDDLVALALGLLEPLVEQHLDLVESAACELDDLLDDLDEWRPSQPSCLRAQTEAPCQSIATTGSLPTTQASCPGGIDMISPATGSSSVPSAITTRMRPLTRYC
jgi:hypothetical protein